MSLTSSRVPSPVPLSIHTGCRSPGTVQMTVTGEIDLATTEQLQAGLLHVLITQLPRHLEVDLAGVTFMGCGGLTVLITAGQAAAHTGCRLQITNPRPIVSRILAITGLLGILTSHPTGHPPYDPSQPMQ